MSRRLEICCAAACVSLSTTSPPRRELAADLTMLQPEAEGGAEPKPGPEPEPEPEPVALALAPLQMQTTTELFSLFSSDSGDDDGCIILPPADFVVPPPVVLLWEIMVSKEIDGGMGLRATADIKQGTEIYREAATLRCPNGHAASSPEQALSLHQHCISERFSQLSKLQQGELMELFSLDAYNDAQGNATIWGIFQTNGLRLSGRDTGDGAIFKMMSRMNHACRPNVPIPAAYTLRRQSLLVGVLLCTYHAKREYVLHGIYLRYIEYRVFCARMRDDYSRFVPV